MDPTKENLHAAIVEWLTAQGQHQDWDSPYVDIKTGTLDGAFDLDALAGYLAEKLAK